MAQWQGLPNNKMPRIENTFEDGVDTENNAFFISPNSYSEGYGWDTDLYPVLSTRKGRTAFGASGGAITRLLANYGNVHLIRAVGTALQYHNGTAWTGISGTWADTDWSAANFDIGGAVVIITNGTDVPQYWNGGTLTAISAMPKGRYIAADNRRVYTSGISGEDDTIHYCAFQDATDWTSPENSGIVQFYTANGGPLTGLHAFEGQIYAFKRDSFAQIFHTGDARVTHRLVEVSNDIGCVSDKTIAEVGPYLMWLGDKDVFMCAGGSAVSIGMKVRKYLQNINPNAITEACAWTDNYRYYICIPTGTSTQNDTELVYDTRYKTWHVRNINLGGLRYAALIKNVPYGGWADGMTYLLNDGTTDNGAAIPFQMVSKPYDEGVGEAEKEYYQSYLQGFIGPGASAEFAVSTDDRGGTWTTLDTLTSDTYSQNKNIIVPMDTVPLTHWLRYRLQGSGYVEFNKIQRFARIQPLQI